MEVARVLYCTLLQVFLPVLTATWTLRWSRVKSTSMGSSRTNMEMHSSEETMSSTFPLRKEEDNWSQTLLFSTHRSLNSHLIKLSVSYGIFFIQYAPLLKFSGHRYEKREHSLPNFTRFQLNSFVHGHWWNLICEFWLAYIKHK